MSRNKSTIWTEAAVREGSWRTGIVFIFNAEWYQSSVCAFAWCWSIFSPTWIQIIPQNPLLKLRVGDWIPRSMPPNGSWGSPWDVETKIEVFSMMKIKNIIFPDQAITLQKQACLGLNYLLVLVILMICLHIYCDVKIRIMFWFGKAMLVCVQRDQFARGRW